MMRIVFLICTLLSVYIPNVKAQSEANIWYFGHHAGLDFSGKTPVQLTDSELSTIEGCASISDRKSNLLFYTDGITVWNREHKVMVNGDQLNGDPSSTQSAIIIPKPESTHLYYIFTIDKEAGQKGFCYSTVDMLKHDGLGQVIQKNHLLRTPVTEKITAVQHRNGKDMWVISHVYDTNEFVAYRVTKNGVSSKPVISKLGSIHQDNKGYLKASPTGLNLALVIEEQQFAEVYEFDNLSGKITQPMMLNLPENSMAYGTEFSPDGSLLYVGAGSTGIIYQYNLLAGSEKGVNRSRKEIGQASVDPMSYEGWLGALQLAPDGKIYVSRYDSPYLGVINHPNRVDKSCHYVPEGFELKHGATCKLGIPTFAQNFFKHHELDDKTIEYFDGKQKIGKPLVLKNAIFNVNNYTLQASSFPELNLLVQILKDNPNLTIAVLGHTDNQGGIEHNLKLSDNRAKSVMKYLNSKGIKIERMTFRGYGSGKPMSSNSTPKGRQKNRRVEVILQD